MHFYEKKGRYIIDFADVPGRRAEMPEISVRERNGNFKEVETGFPEDLAVAEAKRCLSCRRCLGCALCWAECKPEAINFDLPDKDVELTVDRVFFTSGLERRTLPIFGNISDRHMNVVTDLQIERMLAETGPSNGLILRPQDGEIPRRIAFVQTIETVDDRVRDAALIFGINEAIIALRRMSGLEICFVSPNIEIFWNNHGEAPDTVSGISFIDGTVTEIRVVGKDQDIEVKYESSGSEKSETFELAVLLTQPQLPSEIEDAAKQLGVEFYYTSFLGEADEIVKTDKAKVMLARNP